MPSRFIKLPAAVLNDSGLSAEAILAYAFLTDAADRGDRTRVQITLRGLSKRLPRSRDTARRVLRELEGADHICIVESRPGRCSVYRLTHSTDATGVSGQPIAPMPSTHSTNATGTHSTDATLRKRTLNGFDLKDVRSSVRERVEPSNQLLEVLFELGWEGQKIRRETPVIYRQIGGIGNESAFVSEIRRAMMDRRIKNPYAYALALLQRQGPRTAVRRAPNTGDAAADLDTVIRNFLEKRQ